LRLQALVALYWKQVAIVAGAAILAVILVFVIRSARRGSESAASAELAQAQVQLWSEGEGNAARAIEITNQLIERSPGTRSGRIAHLVRGDALLQTKNPEGALAAYRSYLSKDVGDPVLRLSAKRGVAVALEDLGQNAEAAAAYEELAGMSDRPEIVIPDLMSAGRCREKAGDWAAARTIYEGIVQKYPGEPLAADAKLRLEEVERRAPSGAQP
jgi:tetratricopeptide (TPR) repeat protein